MSQHQRNELEAWEEANGVYLRHVQQRVSSAKHQVDVEKALWMTADRMLTGVLGPVSEHGSRVVKFVFTDKEGLVFSWVARQMTLWDHMWIFQEERWSWARRCSRQPIARFGEELSPYGPDLRDKVEAAVHASPNGHSRVWVELPEHCNCLKLRSLSGE